MASTRKRQHGIAISGGQGNRKGPAASSGNVTSSGAAGSTKASASSSARGARRKGSKALGKVAVRRSGKGKPNDGSPASSVAREVKCGRGHCMGQRSDNPRGYQNPACCDVCGVANLVKKRPHFFHCSFCRFDICPQCAVTWEPDGHGSSRKPKQGAPPESTTANADLPKRRAGKGGKSARREEEPKFSKARREIWLPTDATAVNRAPVQTSVVSDWVEGVPL
eukprot:CAMPEP_0183432320 /NCGR_PEP_ID=MMETSP0370-20130417/56934_1 /TAXON_ID=268820 /ORGANISM="Peridinium aciculiferum, Strain PAER-2" /LENGTH=222 /DNA_ID=CAMNT_0025618251 /DNA_START=37 /DNA_END=705 /DNA_ORIENTATION=-